jgi:hypothetical protein
MRGIDEIFAAIEADYQRIEAEIARYVYPPMTNSYPMLMQCFVQRPVRRPGW